MGRNVYSRECLKEAEPLQGSSSACCADVDRSESNLQKGVIQLKINLNI